jgi:hypothetical protein
MTCPQCKRQNPSDTLRCDCGYDLTQVPVSLQSADTKGPAKAPWVLEAAALLLLLANVWISAVIESSSPPAESNLVAGLACPFVTAVIVVGIARLLGGARSRRSIAIVVVVAMSLLFVGQCNRLGSVPGTRGQTAPAPGVR